LLTKKLIALCAFASFVGWGCATARTSADADADGADAEPDGADADAGDDADTATDADADDAVPPDLCGNGDLDLEEACDDGNEDDGDGCAADCSSVADGWTCPTPGSPCQPPFVVRPPTGTLAFVPHETCPDGWAIEPRAAGRLVLGLNDVEAVGCTSGLALTLGEPLDHEHDYWAEVDVPGAGIAGVSGCCNDSTGQSGTYTISGTSGPCEDHTPRIQQNLCAFRGDTSIPAEGHPFPDGAILFFDAPACPAGWTALARANGRFVVPLPEGGTPGAVFGTPLLDGELPLHAHDFSLDLVLPECRLAALGGGNDGPLNKGTYPLANRTTEVSAAPPYVQFLICQAEPQLPPPEHREVREVPVPAGTIAFFDAEECPVGWSRSAPLEGRFLLGLIDGAAPLLTEGGEPLGPGEVRAHTHPISEVVSVPDHSVALASGCCYNQTGCDGDYDVSGSTAAASSDLPYIALRACVRD
jgi:cysteine-rich repeat protein